MFRRSFIIPQFFDLCVFYISDLQLAHMLLPYKGTQSFLTALLWRAAE